MKVIADVSIVPLGIGVSISKYVAECHRIFREAGLKNQLHAYGTNLEGEWEEVFNAISLCHQRIHEMGAPRVSTNIRVGTRTDKDQSMEDKVSSVKKKME